MRAKNEISTKLATGELMGCFGLTEPDHGSNPGGMTTNLKIRRPLPFKWCKIMDIQFPFADIAIVWAKNEEGRIHGLIVKRNGRLYNT